MDSVLTMERHPLTRTVTVIPAKSRTQMVERTKKMRVAAYCRVSTDDEEQLTSYRNQVAAFDAKIETEPSWTSAGIFADEGITGTSTKKRDQFNLMMEQCKRGKIDLIITKSISRFSRNTLDSISCVRELKALGVGVIFEKENINTLNMTNEILFTVLSAFAQAESESISENVKWGKRNGIKNGKVPFQYSRILGYERGEDGKPKIVSEQAETVKRIYAMYLYGYSIAAIKREMEQQSVPAASGKPEWSHGTIDYLLQNEKYIGDVLLQKTYIEDCISKRVRKNNGEINQYYIANNHEGIIPHEIFYKVQEERARRAAKLAVTIKTTKTNRGKYSAKFALTERVVCGECGTRYRRVTWARNGTKRIVWRCINRLEYGTQYCKDSPTIDEERLHAAILKAFHRLKIDRDEMMTALLDDITYAIRPATKFDRLIAEQRIAELNDQFDIQMELIGKQDSVIDFETIQSITTERDALTDALKADDRRKADSSATNRRLAELTTVLDSQEFNDDQYSDVLVRRCVDGVKVLDGDTVSVVFYGGIQVEVGL